MSYLAFFRLFFLSGVWVSADAATLRWFLLLLGLLSCLLAWVATRLLVRSFLGIVPPFPAIGAVYHNSVGLAMAQPQDVVLPMVSHEMCTRL